jgi:hypothetical protein
MIQKQELGLGYLDVRDGDSALRPCKKNHPRQSNEKNKQYRATTIQCPHLSTPQISDAPQPACSDLHCCVNLNPGPRKKIKRLKRWVSTCSQMWMCRQQISKLNSFAHKRSFLSAAPLARSREPQQLMQLFELWVHGISRFSWYCLPSTRRRSRGYGCRSESPTADNQGKRASGSGPFLEPKSSWTTI